MRKYRFGDFELDLDAVALRFNGQPVKLERRPLDLLILLVERQGEMVAREEIIATLWPQRIIIDFESGLNTLVRKVRAALHDSSDEPRFIETIQGRGYRFIGTVTPAAHSTVSEPMASVSEPMPVTPMMRLRRPAGALLLVLAAAFLLWSIGGFREPDLTRIAVLPFENLTGSDELSYLAFGLAEETSISLARVDLPNLRVVGAMTARTMADTTQNVREIGRELGVDFLILSSLRFDDPVIRVASRLIRISDGEQVWAEPFNRELTNVLELQRELSVAIAEQVRQRLSPDVAAAIERRQTENPEAYALYLKGRYQWGQLVPSSNQLALQYYREAVRKDPDYALAWAGIAHLLATSRVTVGAQVDVVSQEAREALRRGIELNPELAEVQYAKGYIDFFLDWDYASAEAAARRSIELDPNSAIAHMLLGVLLSEQGRHVEAISVMRRARELDPLFSLIFANSSMIAWRSGDTRSALELATQAIAISPENWVGHFHLGNTYLVLGDFSKAATVLGDAERLSGGQAMLFATRGYALARMARDEEARAILAELRARYARGEEMAYFVAAVYSGLGEIDSALDWLQQGRSAKEIALSSLRYEPVFMPLHGHPRFEALLSCDSECQH